MTPKCPAPNAKTFVFVDTLASIRPSLSGAANLDRFDYWLSTFQCVARIVVVVVVDVVVAVLVVVGGGSGGSGGSGGVLPSLSSRVWDVVSKLLHGVC
jgi:hypothetical protein